MKARPDTSPITSRGMAIVERSIGWVNNNLLGRNTWYSWAPPEIVARWEWSDHYSNLTAPENKDYWRSRAEGIGGTTPTYLTIPLATRICRTSANLLFGEVPILTVENEQDQERLQQLFQQNRLYTKLKSAAEGVSCVGGIYGMAYVDSRTPRGQKGSLIRFIPERKAVPRFANDDELVEVTFVSEFSEGGRDGTSEVWRLLETHAPGLIQNKLYRGTRTELGKEVSLDSLPQTSGLVPELQTGLDVLDVVYIPNHLGPNSPFGISDLAGIEDLLLAVNEALTLASDDARAAAATIFAQQDLLTDAGNLAEGTRVVPVTPEQAGDDMNAMLEVVQPAIRSGEFASYQDFLIDLTLQAAGFAPQSLGRNVQGGAESGTARRLMMHHTLVEHAGKALLWEDALHQLLDVARQLDAQDYEGKPAYSWNDLEAPISISLRDGMPEDLRETAAAVRDLRGAGTLSIEGAVRMVMTDAEEDAIQAEIQRLEEEQGRIVQTASEQAAAEPAPDVQGILSDLGF
jgi:hypothetical protein